MSEVPTQKELPEDWRWSTLGSVTSYIQRGKSPKYTDFSELPVVNQKCVRWNGIDREHLKYIHPEQFEKWEEKRYLNNGDLLWNSTGTGTIGRAALVTLKDGERLVADSHVTVVRSAVGIKPRYVHYWIMSPAIQNSIEAIQSGSTNQVELSKGAVESTPIPLAPIDQQKRIVAKIEELFSHIDAGIESLKKAKQLLKQYRQSVLKAAVTGELTKEWREANKDKLEPASKLLEQIENARNKWFDAEANKENSEAKRLKNKLKKHSFEKIEEELIPEEWISVSLLKVCLLVVDCHNKTAPYVGNGIPLIRTSNIRDGMINFEDKMKYVDQKTYDFWSRRCLPKPGDILFTREAPMGESAIIPDNTKVCMGQRMMLFRVIHDLVDVNYLHLALMDPLFQKRLQSFKVGVGVQHLRVGDVEKAVISLPSTEEQKEIVRVTNEKLRALTRVENDIEQQLVRTEKTKQSILVSAFTGKLVDNSEVKNTLPFLRVFEGITETDLHAGVIALAIRTHAKDEKTANTLGHVKCEKISHLVESHLGISLGRQPYKDAAGPNDYKHLHKINSRGNKAGWFEVQNISANRHKYIAKPGIEGVLEKLRAKTGDHYEKIENLVALFVPMKTQQAEIVATLYAGWNNLLLDGKTPSDEEIVYESRENWHESKLKIERDRFFRALAWMREHELVPKGLGYKVNKK